ncbi:MAG: replication factor C large subunit [Thermoproteota archaeon]
MASSGAAHIYSGSRLELGLIETGGGPIGPDSRKVAFLETSSEPWTDKHKPSSVSEIVGNEGSVKRVFDWLRGWERGRKALLLHGPPGVGKTASVEAAARELGYIVLEMNASDVRTEERINELALPAASSRSFSGKRRLILFDEVDGIYGRSDSGGLKAILKIIDIGTVPVAMTANDPWSEDLRALRAKAEMVEFRRVPASEVAKRLRKICALEGLVADDSSILKLAEGCGGDVRSAIEDLQAASTAGKLDESASVRLGSRLRQERIFDTLRGIFNASSVDGALRSLDNSVEDYEDVFEWVYEYLPKAMRNEGDLVEALEYVAKADLVFRHVRRTNDWSRLPYFLKLFAAGAALSKSSAETTDLYYGEKPDRLKNRWRYFNARRRLESSSLALARELHCGARRAKVEVLPLYRLAARSKKGGALSRALEEAGVDLGS